MNTIKTLVIYALLFLLGLAPFAVVAHGYKTRTIEIVHPWTYEHESAGDNEAIVGMEIRNRGKSADRLIRVEGAKGQKVEIRGGTPAAGKRPAGIEVLPGIGINLKSDGAHIFLGNVGKTLIAYDTLPLTLVFERAGRIKIDVMVEERPPVK